MQGDYRIAHADYNIALGQYEEAIIQALNEVSDALTSQNALNYRISKAEEALAASKNAYDIINKRYVAGLANYLEVLKAEEALIMDRAAFLELEARGFILEIAVIKSLGGWYKNV